MIVAADLSGIALIKELGKLRQLRKLAITRLTAEATTALFACIEEMNHLESLSLSFKNDGGMLNLETISSPPPHLERLVLKCRLQVLPDWISGLQNLSMLCLSLSSLTDDPLRHVGVLPNLVSLWLYRAYEGTQLHFEVGGFRKLKLLVLRDMQGLELVEIEEGALPLLEELRIGPSPLLDEVPSGLQHLRSLKVLAFYDMPNELVHKMQPNGGSDYVKVEHVPSVLFWYRISGRSYASYELGEQDLLDRLQGLDTNMNDVTRHVLQSFSFSDDIEADSASASTSAVPPSDERLSFSGNRISFGSDWLSDFSDDIED
ncbi:hypothetical protein TIFTF001_049717 [Ficus carica]|uniref:Disease resistance R13L4/SHOC-2-like LRR domain-containing protein n=1 Tax=Ficus carica TaxID=3494 RepID=A0AA87Z8Y6_FICCA|nr:hypothetical protein TIFTF001_049717 [Ficus carica]